MHLSQLDHLIDFLANKCVCTYDHHSIWIGNWIGEQNRKFYFVFLVIYLAQITYSLVLWYIRFSMNVKYNPIAIICLILSSICTMFLIPIVFYMMLFQIYLAWFNFTSVEIEYPEKFIEKHAILLSQTVIKRRYWYYFISPFGKGLTRNLADYFWKTK